MYFQEHHGHSGHAGGLGNIEAGNHGVANVFIEDRGISLSVESPNYIGNRTVVIHQNEDDLGQGANFGSKIYGNAGHRIACGIIKILNEPPTDRQVNPRVVMGQHQNHAKHHH